MQWQYNYQLPITKCHYIESNDGVFVMKLYTLQGTNNDDDESNSEDITIEQSDSDKENEMNSASKSYTTVSCFAY